MPARDHEKKLAKVEVRCTPAWHELVARVALSFDQTVSEYIREKVEDGLAADGFDQELSSVRDPNLKRRKRSS